MNKKCLKVFATSALAFGLCASSIPLVTINADDGISAIALAGSSNTQGGIANLGGGSAQITIKGNDGQSMVGKKFGVYKLFNAENAVGILLMISMHQH